MTGARQGGDPRLPGARLRGARTRLHQRALAALLPSRPPLSLAAVLPSGRLHRLALAAVLALSTVLNTYRLSQNGYANIFYSAGVKSMLHSLHNFAFVSFDAGGLISVDKPPLGLWVQVASAKLFGFSPLSLMLPEAIAGVLAVALLYHLLSRRLGAFAGLAGALALAVFPSFVAVSRENSLDSLLILLMILACGAALRAVETGRWRTLLWCGGLVGLAFNTKTLAAYLVVPGIAAGFIVCAPGSLPRRATQLLTAGLLMVAVSVSWLAFVDLTPASARPYVGSSTNNSEFGLTFEYNGFGRVSGQVGGPGRVPVRAGARVHALPPRARRRRPAQPAASSLLPPARIRASAIHGRPKNPVVRNLTAKHPIARSRGAKHPNPTTARATYPVPFGGPPGPLRLFGKGLGDQGAWILPFALIGLLALALLTFGAARRPAARGPEERLPEERLAEERPAEERRSGAGRRVSRRPVAGQPGAPRANSGDGRRRGDPRLAVALILGGWFLTEAAVLSLSKGIVHPYYVSALAPGAAAMAGAGAAAFTELARGGSWRMALAPAAVAATVAVQVLLLEREHYMQWFIPVLIAGAAVGVVALLAPPRLPAAPVLALTFCLLLAAPAAYASTTWLAPVEGTFPAAGPTQAIGAGGVGVGASRLPVYLTLLDYVSAHGPGSRWPLFTDAATTASPFILLGMNAGSLAGYSGTDPAIDGRGLARLLARGQARYVVLGGEFSARGGNGATAAVLRACRQLPPSAWHDMGPLPETLVLFDCAGRERELAAA